MRWSWPMSPAIEAMLMTRPHFAGIIERLPTSCVSTNTPVRFTFTSLSQRFERMILGRRAPGGAGVVHQDVDLARIAAGLLRRRRDGFAPADVADIGSGIDLPLFQMGDGFVELVLLARGDRDPGAHLAERLGHLQAEAARAAGDERVPSPQAEKVKNLHPFSCSDLYSRNSSSP